MFFIMEITIILMSVTFIYNLKTLKLLSAVVWIFIYSSNAHAEILTLNVRPLKCGAFGK
jgi:hypothetical protein